MKRYRVVLPCGGNFYYQTIADVVVSSGWNRPPGNILEDGPWNELVKRYYRGGRPGFSDVVVDISGLSLFARKILLLVRQLEWGETMTYSGLARLGGMPAAARAVGRALGANPVPLFIPCHRIVGFDGLGGFSSGLARKRQLLCREGILKKK